MLMPNLPDIEGALRLLKSDDVQIRQFTAYLLGQVGSPRVVDALIEALRDENVGVRGAAANALGAIGSQQAVPHLQPLLDDPNPQLALWSAFALTRLGHDHFPVLVVALSHEAVEVRRSAILALRQLGDVRAIDPLLTLRGDQSRRFEDDLTVAEAAAQTLKSLGYDLPE